MRRRDYLPANPRRGEANRWKAAGEKQPRARARERERSPAVKIANIDAREADRRINGRRYNGGGPRWERARTRALVERSTDAKIPIYARRPLEQ